VKDLRRVSAQLSQGGPDLDATIAYANG